MVNWDSQADYQRQRTDCWSDSPWKFVRCHQNLFISINYMEYLHSINKQGGKLNGNERITSIEEMKKWK